MSEPLHPSMTLDGRLPAPIQAAASPRPPRGSAYHYDACGCGTRPWSGCQADVIWQERLVPRQLAPDTMVLLPPDPATGYLNDIAAYMTQSLAGRRHLLGGAATEAPPPSSTVDTTPCGLASLLERPKALASLRVAYLIPHHNVTGGMKMIVAQIRLLGARGHKVTVVFRGPPGSPVLPPWASDVEVAAAVLLGTHDTIEPVMRDNDVVVIGYFTQLLEFAAITQPVGPIVYWDQGHEHLFGDATASLEWDKVFHQVMHLPIALLSVSTVVKEILATHFSRVAPVVPNAIDTSVFYPPPAPVDYDSAVKHVLIVGHPGLALKNFATALCVLNNVHQVFPDLKVTWMCQQEPVVSAATFPVEFVVNPAQAEVPNVYRRGFHAMLFTSFYEAWGMPVMEAMATGIPVVTSCCFGVDMFCKPGVNCLMAEPADVGRLSEHLIKVLGSPELSSQFSKAGVATVKDFTWDKTMTAFEDCLTLVACRLGTLQSRLEVDPYHSSAKIPAASIAPFAPLVTTTPAPTGGRVATITYPVAAGPPVPPTPPLVGLSGGWDSSAAPLGLPPPTVYPVYHQPQPGAVVTGAVPVPMAPQVPMTMGPHMGMLQPMPVQLPMPHSVPPLLPTAVPVVPMPMPMPHSGVMLPMLPQHPPPPPVPGPHVHGVPGLPGPAPALPHQPLPAGVPFPTGLPFTAGTPLPAGFPAGAPFAAGPGFTAGPAFTAGVPQVAHTTPFTLPFASYP